jgi:hypothetical protein
VSEQLYHEGGELMKAGKTHEACAKFAASYRADNTAVGSLLATAACHEKEGKVAAAWGEYGAVAAIAARDGQADRQQYATDHAKALEPKLHHVVLAPAFDVAKPPAGLTVQLDGASFDPGAFNSQIPIDAGDHTLEVSATGKKLWTNMFTTASDTKTDTITIPALVDAPKNQSQTIIIKDESSTHWNKTKLALGIIFGTVGVGGVGAAVGLGLDASSLNTRSQANPPPANADELHSTAELTQNLAIVSGIVGGLSLIAGIFFIVTAPETKTATPPPSVDKAATLSNLKINPVVGPHFNGFGLGGSF